MSTDNRDPNEPLDPFAERVARVLRAPERFGDDFEESLVAALREDRPIAGDPAPRRRPLTAAWWSAPSLRFSPLAGLALAASLIAVAGVGTLALARRRVIEPPVAPALASAPVHDTVTYVRFVFVGRAKSVALVGDFNAWGATPTLLAPTGPRGAWTASVPLPNGRHEYAFIVDGKRWTPDPYAPTSSDEFDANSSVITIGD